MRKPIKPFAIETRRTGRKAPAQPAAPWSATPGPDEAPKTAPLAWPSLPEEDEDSYGAAMRAADALFSRPPDPVEPQPDTSSAAPSAPPRRILEALDEDDHIARLLAEEEQLRPRRGRKPRSHDDAAPAPRPQPAAAPADAPAPALAEAEMRSSNGFIPGYVRGQIFARYARHDQTRPGEQWRKRSLKPNW